MTQKVERVSTSLQIEEDVDLHLKGWVFQRIGWALMLLFLTSAALGFFGNGLVSKKALVMEGSSLVFERFTREDSDTEMVIMAQDDNGIIKVSLSPQFAENFKVESILPEPQKQTVKNGFVVYEFEAQARAELTFFLTSRKSGPVHSTVFVNDTEYKLKQFIYP